MRYVNKLEIPIIVKGVGEVAPGGEFETDDPVLSRYAVPVEEIKQEDE